MLPDDHWVFVQVGDVSPTAVLWILIQNHPHKMRIPKTLHDAVWVLDSIGPSMVCPVLTAPPPDRALDGATTDTCEEYSDWEATRDIRRWSTLWVEASWGGGKTMADLRLVRSVRPQTMVASCDTQSGPEVVENCPSSCDWPEMCIECSNNATDWYD